MSRIKGLKEMILHCLEKHPNTRNSDIGLTLMIWWIFYNDKIKMIDGEAYIHLKSLYDIPREDSVKRIRANIQNIEGKFLPTSEAVRKARRIKEIDCILNKGPVN